MSAQLKNVLPYYKAYPRDFIEGTIGLNLELKGAYRVLLDLIYMQSGKLRDDARYISGLLGCSVRKWETIRMQLICLQKIDIQNGFISNKRARAELDSTLAQQKTNAENGSKSHKNSDVSERSVRQPEPEPEPYKEKKEKEKNTHIQDLAKECRNLVPDDKRTMSGIKETEEALAKVLKRANSEQIKSAIKAYWLKTHNDGYGGMALHRFLDKRIDAYLAHPDKPPDLVKSARLFISEMNNQGIPWRSAWTEKTGLTETEARKIAA